MPEKRSVIGRRFIGITGPPGSGKSTVASTLVSEIGPEAIVVPMDGFHLAQCELERRGLADRKGAPETFDVEGFVGLLHRLRTSATTVMAPEFRREIEEPIAGSLAVEPHHVTIVVEGNYLLHDRDGWERVEPLLDECWYVVIDAFVRRERLRARHVAHGRSPQEADAWMASVDDPNSNLIERTRDRATRIVRDTQLRRAPD